MYSVTLLLHSWLRWVVLLLAILVIVRAATGSRAQWTAADNRWQVWFTAAVDLQMVLGLILYVALSPTTQEAFKDFGAAMRISSLRFFAVEHLTGMIAAVAFAHVGRALARKAPDADGKRRRTLIFTSLSLLVMLASIPWAGLPNGRPLFRFGL